MATLTKDRDRGYANGSTGAEFNHLPVVASGTGDVGKTVYTTDDDTFMLTVGTNPAIGKVARHVVGTKCLVAFGAASARSL